MYRQLPYLVVLKEMEDGVEGRTLHDLRRTYRTIHGSIGTPANIGEYPRNHVAAVTTEVERIYDRHTYLPEMRAAVERWDARFRRSVSRALGSMLGLTRPPKETRLRGD